MRFIPLNAKNRDDDTGNGNWNMRYLRAVKVILNVMKGPVMPGRQFFIQAFGENEENFKEIMSMPDEFIRNRLVNNWREISDIEGRWMPYVKEWMNTFRKLSPKEKNLVIEIIGPNDKGKIKQVYDSITNKSVRKLLKFHIEENEIVAECKGK